MERDYFAGIHSMVERLGANPIPIQLPYGKEDALRGVFDLIEMKAYVYDDESLGAAYTVEEIPSDSLGCGARISREND